MVEQGASKSPVRPVKRYRRIAILNRGEAAVRFVRSLREFDAAHGTETECVAFFTTPDAGAPFVRMADDVVDLGAALRPGGVGTVSAYCDHEHVLAALAASSCDAVWPGWGFASEDADFVEKLEGVGIRFIGPSAAAMRAVGDKIGSKEHAVAAGLPVGPWSPLVGDETAEQLEALAEPIGYPLMVKASAGGGGRGIRRVTEAAGLLGAVTSASAEAERSFGDRRLFIEAAISGARHVEVQFAVDGHGNAFALGVRDCSVQRRNQKLIEESPSPVLPEALGQQIMDGACEMAKAVGYRGVGTVEFLYRPTDGTLSFLEVNSRLQVEHTITEALTGADLVQAQLVIALGEAWSPPDVARGHAIEARVNAENVDEGFRPAPGRVRVFRPPAGPGVRVDSGIVEGAEIPAEFDSMIAKVIAYAPTRSAAIARLKRALRELDVVIEGGATNKAFLTELLSTPEFVDGTLSTDWLDRRPDAIRVATPANEAAALVTTAILAHVSETGRHVASFMNQAQNGVPQNLPAPSGRLLNLRLRGRSVALHVYCVGEGRYEVASSAGTYQARFEQTGRHSAMLVLDGVRHRVLFAESASSASVEVDGVLHAITLAEGGSVVAPAPAMVIEMFVKEGDTVEAGDLLAMLEAMKMELPVRALEGGVVRRVRCRAAEQVASGQVLVELETTDSGDGADTAALVELPPARGSLVDLLFETGMPRPDRVDDAPREFVTEIVKDVVATVRSVLLGYDVSVDTARRIEVLFGARLEFAGLRRHEHWAELVAVLTVFVDTEELFGRTLEGYADDGSEVSAQLAFFEYCRLHERGEEGAPDLVRTSLTRALAHYSVDGFEPTDTLREALWRLSVANAHSELRYRVCSSLLRLVIGLAEIGVPMHGFTDLPTTLSRVFEVSPDSHPYVADNARQALYVLYKRPLYVARGAELRETHDRLAVLDDGVHAPAASEEYYLALSQSAQTVLPQLITNVEPDRPDVATAAQAIASRVWGRQVPPLTPVEFAAGFVGVCDSFAVVIVEGTQDVTAACEAALQAGAHAVDVVVVDGSEDAPRMPTTVPETGRITVLRVGSDGDEVMASTNVARDGAWHSVEGDLGVHPEFAARLEMDRLSEFELSRVRCPERMLAFTARARSNARDERIFVRAEVTGGATEVPAGDWPRWEFEKVYYEGLRIIREAQAGRGRRNRFYRNRLTVYVRPVLSMDANKVNEIARGLEAPTRRLGLESVNVRARVRDEAGVVRDIEFVISKPGRHRLDVRTRPPVAEPIQPLTAYEQRVVRARRLGLVYPYEIIQMLEGRGSEAADASFAVDRGEFVEFDLNDAGDFVPVDRPYGGNTCGIIVGLITNESRHAPNGMKRVFVANDPTRSLGSLAEPECRRVLGAIELAEREGLSIEWIAISSGARIAMDSGTENLDWTAQVLRRIVEFTQDGGEINVVVAGVNVGAQAYWNAQATTLMHTRGILIMTHDGAMVLTGKRALEYSGSVSAEDEKGIGGADRIMGPNGQAHYVARDLGAAYAILFSHYRYTHRPPGHTFPLPVPTADPLDRSILDFPYEAAVGGFTKVGELFDEATNPGRKKPFAIRALMRAVIDQDAGHVERWRPFRPAEMIVAWDTAIGGRAVSLIGVESRPLPRFGRVPADGPDRWTGATLFPKSSKKLARALNAASGARPCVVLANLSGFDGSPESLRKWQLEYGAEIGRAVVNFKGPLIFVIVGRYHGGAYVVFSKALNPALQSIALEGSYASVIGGGPAAAVVFPREVRRRADADPQIKALTAELESVAPVLRPRLREAIDELYADVLLREQQALAAEFDAIHTVQRAVAVGSLDAVIPAASLRPEIIRRIVAAQDGEALKDA